MRCREKAFPNPLVLAARVRNVSNRSAIPEAHIPARPPPGSHCLTRSELLSTIVTKPIPSLYLPLSLPHSPSCSPLTSPCRFLSFTIPSLLLYTLFSTYLFILPLSPPVPLSPFFLYLLYYCSFFFIGHFIFFALSVLVIPSHILSLFFPISPFSRSLSLSLVFPLRGKSSRALFFSRVFISYSISHAFYLIFLSLPLLLSPLIPSASHALLLPPSPPPHSSPAFPLPILAPRWPQYYWSDSHSTAFITLVLHMHWPSLVLQRWNVTSKCPPQLPSAKLYLPYLPPRIMCWFPSGRIAWLLLIKCRFVCVTFVPHKTVQIHSRGGKFSSI